jgi:hypothetical protein
MIHRWMTDPKAEKATEGGLKQGWRVLLIGDDATEFTITAVDQAARTVALTAPDGASRVVAFTDLSEVTERPVTAWEQSVLAPFYADPEVSKRVAHLAPCTLSDWIWTAWQGMKGGRRSERILASLRPAKVAQTAQIALPTGRARNAQFIQEKNTPLPPSPARVAKNSRAGKAPAFDVLPDPTQIP